MASGVSPVFLARQFVQNDEIIGNNHLLRGKFSSCSITMKVYSCMTVVDKFSSVYSVVNNFCKDSVDFCC